MARNPQDYVGDTTGSQMPGLSGTAAAFQSGAGKKKQEPQQGQQQPQSGGNKKGGGGLGGLVKKVGGMFGRGKQQAPAPAGGGAMAAAQGAGMPQTTFQAAQPFSNKKGGRIKRTGLALVHKGEVVVPAGKSRGGRKRIGGKQRTITKA